MEDFLRNEAQATIRHSSETVVDIHPFCTIKHIKYFTVFFLIWGSESTVLCPSTAPDGNTSTYRTVNILHQPLWSLFTPRDQSYTFQSLQDTGGYVCSLPFSIKLQTVFRLTFYSQELLLNMSKTLPCCYR